MNAGNERGRFCGLSDEHLQLVNSACETFERAMTGPCPVSIEDLLVVTADAIQAPLLKELLAIEFEHLLARELIPNVSDYLARFPDATGTVRQVFERVMNEESVGDGRTSDARARPAETDSKHTQRLPLRIGRYRIEHVLGEGGFGIVYRAMDEQLKRRVAVKVPNARLVSSPESIELYLAEARSTAVLDHANIVPIYDVGSSEEADCFFVSRYVEGTDLASKLRQGRFSHQAAAALVATVAESLQYAHSKGIVHRDVKPSNILVDHDGQPHLVDFGLALRDECIGQGPRYVGTPAYMSPEQAQGEGHRVDGRSDVFSLGVVFYELLTGQRPFYGDTPAELLEQLDSLPLRPPRQYDAEVPHELQRICLRALARRARDRYSSAQDMADDLRRFLVECQRDGIDEDAARKPARTDSPESSGGAVGASPSSPNRSYRIVPKGLRSFDGYDADFFLELLPGARDRVGLPQSIRFWKDFAEDVCADRTRAVGVIYGPSGCGKSSLVKAGFMPRLAKHVESVYVEACSDETEMRLLSALRSRFPTLPDHLGIKDTVAALRHGQGAPTSGKVLIVIDQFEQWLHADHDARETELVQALRQCDGGRVQCIVIVRDDFWMAATRFMGALEIPLLEGRNANAVDLFAPRHAEKVLADFGRAFGVLPANPDEFTEEQRGFLKQAVEGLAEHDKVVCVRLALLAQMMKDKEWSPRALERIGGISGVGVSFLEESFSAATATPEHRHHGPAARAVLQTLLPNVGADIKGHMQSRDSLREASGYADRRREFDDLMRILDGELRLITPIEADSSRRNVPAGSPENDNQKYYQLTHDYLVPSLRDWLARKQQETRRGRAELWLAQRSALWNSKPENSLLPSLLEFLSMSVWTRKSHWTEPQRKMMRQARRIHGLRWGGAIAIVFLIGIVLERISASINHRHALAQTTTAVSALEIARGSVVPQAIRDLEELPRQVVLDELRSRFSNETVAQQNRLSLAFALAQFDELDAEFLIAASANALATDVQNFHRAFHRSREKSLREIRFAIAAREADRQWRPMARLAIFALYLDEPSFAQDMCRLAADPLPRTMFIDEHRIWHGDVAQIASRVAAIDDPAWRSAICLAVGNVPEDELGADAKSAWEPIISDWYQHQPDSGAHSAAGWTLRQWNLQLPAIPPSEKPIAGNRWHVNSVGMTMLAIPASTFSRHDLSVATPAYQTVTLTKAFLLSDREISVGTFRQFVTDPDYPSEEKPVGWTGEDTAISPTSEHPVQFVNWYDAVLFCNWLSRQEGLAPCYERTGLEEKIDRGGFQAWRRLHAANGYRLPTEAEWECANQAGTTTDFSFGDDVSLLNRHAVFAASTTEICGKLLPSGWGLFDTMGNVLEWCEDWRAPYGDKQELRDPLGAEQGMMRVMRGGTYFNPSSRCRAGDRNDCGPWGRSNYNGFRVARTITP